MNIIIILLAFILSTRYVQADTINFQRTADKFVKPNGSYEVHIRYTPDQDFQGQIVEKVPYDAVVEPSNFTQHKTLSDLNLRFPFDDSFPVTLTFGQVNPGDHFGIGLHDGVDFAMPEGTPIIAVDDGEIAPYREQNHYGITVAIQHSWGQTFYGHLSKTNTLIGKKIRKGEIIGLSGNTGLSSGPHLHFGMKFGDQFVNALPYFAKQNNEKIAQKSLIWNISAKKGDQLDFSYRYSLPDAYKERGILALGPALITSSSLEVISREEKEWELVLTDNPGSIEALVRDPHTNRDTSLAVEDNVVLWVNSDKRVLHGYDSVTDTKFEIPFDERSKNSFLIDTTEYLAQLEDNQLKLSLAP